MQDTLAKKIFAVGSAVAMTVSLAMPFAAHAAAHGVGTNVSSSDGTIWMITASGTRRAYTSAGAFLSYGFNSFSTVVPASSDDLALPVDAAGFIPPQDGTIFCATATKASDVKGECSLISGGQKYAFTSAAVFTGLGFSFSRAQYGDSSFLTKSSNISSSTSAHLPGVLVNNAGTVQLVGTTGLLGIPDLATFNSWGYSFANVVPANSADKAMSQTGVMAARQAGQLSPTALASTGSNGGTVVSGSVSASLSSGTPAAATLVSSHNNTNNATVGQTGADLAHFTFTGTGTVTQVVVNRIGVSSDTSVNNVYLYQGNNRITDAGSFSSGKVTFSNSNGLFTVSGTAEISVRVDVAGEISGQTIGAQLASFTVANGTPVSASISGNLFTIAQISNLATVSTGGLNGGIPGTSINAGTMNANLWSMPVNVGQRAVSFRYIQFKQIGSVSASAIQNLHLYVDGASVGPVSSITNSGSNTNVVIFDMTGSPVTLQTGSHTLELHGDVIGGTSYNFNFTLQQAADAVFYDSNYMVNVPLTLTGGATLTQLSPGTTSVNSGTVSVQSDSTFTATQFVKNASQVTLGQWTMKSYGENVKVQNLQVNVVYTSASATVATLHNGEGFNNLSVYVNGGQVGSSLSATVNADSTTGAITKSYTFGSTNLFTIPAGTTVTVAVKGDSVLDSVSSTDTNVATVQAGLVTPVNSLQGVTSFTLSPSTSQPAYTATALSIVSSNATLAKNTAYASQTVASNSTKQKIGSFVIQANNAEGLRVTSLTVALASSTPVGNECGGSRCSVFNTAGQPTGLANLYIVTPDQTSGTTPVNPQATGNNFSVNFTIAANQTATVDVYADVSNVTGNVIATLSGSGTGSSSNQSVTMSGQQGQTITIGNGQLSAGGTILQTSSPVASFVISGGASQPAATFNFVATSGAATIQEMDFDVVSSTGSVLSNVPVTAVTVGGITASMVGASSTVTGLSIAVPTTLGGVDVPVTMNLATVGNNGIPSGQPFVLRLIRVKYLSGSNTSYLPSATTYMTNKTSNAFDLVGSAPTVTLTASGNTLTTGVTIGSVAVAANAAGNVKITSIPLSVSANNATSTGIIQLVDASSGVVAAQTASVTVGPSTATTTLAAVFNTNDNNVAAGTTKTYNIVLPTVNTVSGANNFSVTVGLGNAQYLTFTDVNGGVTVAGNDGTNTYIVNYPTNTVTSHQ